MTDDQHYDVVIIGTGAGGGYPGSDDWDYPLGGIQMLGKSDDEEIRAQSPRWAGKISPDLPFEVLAHHAGDFWLCGEDLPQPDNRATLDADDAIHLSIDEKNNVEGVKRLRHKLDGMLGQLGMHEHHMLDRSLYLYKSMPIGAVNPSLTAIANSLRVGDHLTERLG